LVKYVRVPAQKAHPAFACHISDLAHLCAQSVPCILAAMTPCSRLYGFLGTRLAPLTRADSPYIEWVRTYADAEYQALPQRMEALLDELGEAEDFGEVPCSGISLLPL